MTPSLWIALEKLFQQGIWLLLFIVLAPMLGPRPYGSFAIVMVFVGFCEFVIVESAAEALIGMKVLDEHHLKTATTCNFAVALLTGVVVFLAAPLFAEVFGDPELCDLFRALAILPAIAALTSAPVAILKRQMHFRPLAVRSTVGLTVGGLAGIALAFEGAGVWSLVGQALAQRIAEVLILTTGPSTRLRFGWSSRHLADLRGYALHVFVSRSMAFASGQIPRLVLGFFLGPVELGLYALAYRFPDIICQITIVPRTMVARIALKRYQGDNSALDAAFRRMVSDIAIVALPLSFGGAAIVPALFRVWLDARWQGGIPATQILMLSVPLYLVSYCNSAILMAQNHPRYDAKISTVDTVSNALCVLAAASLGGLNLVCLVMILRPCAVLPWALWVVRKQCHVHLGLLARTILPLLFAAAGMAGVVLGCDGFMQVHVGPALALPGLILIGAAVYTLLISLVARSQARALLDRVPRMKALRGRGGNAGSVSASSRSTLPID